MYFSKSLMDLIPGLERNSRVLQDKKLYKPRSLPRREVIVAEKRRSSAEQAQTRGRKANRGKEEKCI